jgi:GNAT superfamily N-acetyltransferase
MSTRAFKGVATILLQYAANYAKNNLKLRYAFSLHALPKARGFYETIGVTIQRK